MKQCSWQEIGIVIVVVVRFVVVVVANSRGGIGLGHWHHVDPRGTAAITSMMMMIMVPLTLRIGERSVCG